MTETPSARQSPYERWTFRYGMLLLIAVLWCVDLWSWLSRTPQDRAGPSTNLVVASMLLVNHVIASFLSAERQRRVRLVQVIFLAICGLLVFRRVFSI